MKNNLNYLPVFLLTLVLFLSSVTDSSANRSNLPQSNPVTIVGKDVKIKDVLNEIEKQTPYLFTYDNQVNVNQTISVELKETQLDKALNQIFAGKGISYRIEGRNIVLSKKKEEEKRQGGQTSGSQTRISGRVTDTGGEPLPGVTVFLRATSIGTVTDGNGNFSINLPNLNSPLVFNSLGYAEQEVVPQANTPMNVTLRENDQVLDEIVVVGYGIQKRLEVTSAVSSIKTEELVQSPTANISSALAGRLPGLITVQNSGEPGADQSKMWIRGIGTYNGDTTPLVLVDGVERDMNVIDPNEIEDVTILKDASATAVYGIRGANGVVLITTKRGQVDRARVNFTYQHGITTPTRIPEYLDSFDALTLYAEGLDNDGKARGLYTDDYIALFRDRSKPAYKYLYPSVNWLDEMLKKTSNQDQVNLNVSGGGSIAKYFVSVSYLNQEGMYKHTESIKQYDFQARLQRYNFRSNIDLNLTKFLTMELNVAGTVRNQNYPGGYSASSIFSELKRTRPWQYPVMNPDGSNAGTLNFPNNPYVNLTQRGYQSQFNTTFQATGAFRFDLSSITKGLSAKIRYSFDTYNYRNVTRSRTPELWEFTIDPEEADLTKGTYIQHREASDGGKLGYSVNANASRKSLAEIFINYDRTFGKNKVAGLVLYNQGGEYRAIGGGIGNAIDGLPYRRQGFAGRFNYSFDDRYFAEVNFAWNGSEQFSKGNRFGFFPSGSIGWVISNEKFVKDNASWLNLLKIRASVGQVGNDQIGGKRFLYQSQWSLEAGGYTFGKYYNGDSYKGAEEGITGNWNTTWEKATKYNVGIDLAFFNNSLRLEADYFYEYRTHILTDPSSVIPQVIGLSYNNYPSLNAGIMENQGFEVDVSYRKNIRGHDFFVKGNFAYTKNKIIDCLEPSRLTRPYAAKTGTQYSEKFGYEALGLFSDWDDIANSPEQTFGQYQPGDIKYKDMNKDGVIDNKDRAYLGKVGIPPMTFGFSLGYSYKGFDVSVLFQGALGAYVMLQGNEVYPFSKNASVMADVRDSHYHYVNNPNPNARWPRMTSEDSGNNYIVSSFWLRSSDYLRLKNVELGYTLPKRWMSKIGIDKLRIYATGLNLVTWDQLKIFDPEIADGSGTYPQQKVFNFGVSITY